jgi:hypothetical protein
MERERDGGNLAERDLNNEKFWQKLRQTFSETVELVRADAKERGIDLDDPELIKAAVAHSRAERRLAAKNRPLARAAMAYLKAVDKWFADAQPAFRAKGLELETLARLETGNPQAEAAGLIEFVDVIRWYQHFIYVKLCRAIESRASEELETDTAMLEFPKDSNGSAKIALIAIDRSIAAWSGLRTALGGRDEEDVLDLLVQLASIRRAAEELFPGARAFVRPGFDSK